MSVARARARRLTPLGTLALSAGLVCVATAPAPAHAETRRIAVIVGHNAGRPPNAPLRYAESDAGKVARVLIELGEVDPDDLLLLQGVSAEALERGLRSAAERVAHHAAAPDVRTLMFFYFSGHSDGEAIELGDERVSYAKLKALLSSGGADVRVIVVDACRSGSALKLKGARPAEPFVIRMTDQLEATGEVFIASTAADESALESAEVKGGVFTHSFVSGLRGVADRSGDGLVTLAEAYRYAYDRTVAASALTPAGPQHPSFDYRLSGRGELVLSVLARASASLRLPDDADRVLVYDVARDHVLLEVGRATSKLVALPAGDYGVRAIRRARTYEGRVRLVAGQTLQLGWERLMVARSDVGAIARRGAPGSSGWRAAEASGVWVSASAGASLGVVENTQLHPALRVGVAPAALRGVSVAAVVALGRRAAVLSESSAQLRAGWSTEVVRSPVALSLGAEGALSYLWQAGVDGGGRAFALGGGPRASARLDVLAPLFVTLESELMIHGLRVDDALRAVLVPGATLGLGVKL